MKFPLALFLTLLIAAILPASLGDTNWKIGDRCPPNYRGTYELEKGRHCRCFNGRLDGDLCTIEFR